MAKIEKTQHTTVNLGKGFLIEAPCFFDNIKELEAYIKGLGISYEGTVIAYHGAGASFMKNTPVYSTRNADEYSHKGGGASLVSNFAAAFGDSFDSSIYNKRIAAENKTAEDFKAAVQKKYSGYSGLNYLDMTAGFFYK